jgi:hypothetical protein
MAQRKTNLIYLSDLPQAIVATKQPYLLNLAGFISGNIISAPNLFP